MILISPTQIDKYRRCQRLISYEYVEHMAPPTSPKMKFGTDVHNQLERWLREGTLPDDSPAGKVALQGIRGNWLPTPRAELIIEHDFNIAVENNMHLRGRIDCLVPPGIVDKIPVVIDHKTTSGLAWAKTEHELRADPQAIIYSVFAALRYDARLVKARWVYYAASNPKTGPRRPAGAKPVEALFDVSSDRFLAAWDVICDDIEDIRRIRFQEVPSHLLPPSPDSCSAFGGCPYKNLCQLSGLDQLEAAIRKESK